ncbi:MAG TPA: SH3 domain-containing protein [Oceanobacillus sp.]|nr:SH3 domain-containing protein [Oceanobacillus sp.]
MKSRLLGLLFIAALLLANAFVTSAQSGCPATRLTIGMQARVTPGLPNVLRDQPMQGTFSNIIGQIPAGGGFIVIGGPQCNNNMNWWQVNYNGLIGWTPEASSFGEFWTEPIYCAVVPPRLVPGQQGRVTPGLPNVLRTLPQRGAASAIIGEIPGGAVFSVISGPQCSEGMSWWQVNYNGLIGWTPENSSTGEYWLEPYSQPIPYCFGAPTPHMLLGLSGYVTLGPSNNLRVQPSLDAAVVGQMPGGSMFTVLAGPTCANGYNWWQVNHNGLIGWTAEGIGNQYWIEPVMCYNTLPSRMTIGMWARITPGLPNRLRAQPSTTSSVLALIPAGGQFSIIAGPQCSENTAWWQVNYNGIVGWTMEGQNGEYWLEPVY